MGKLEAPLSIREQMVVQRVGAETLVYDERRHKAFCLNETSSVVWTLADGKRTVAQISTAAAVELKYPVSEELVHFALQQLRADGLMELPPVAANAATVSRRVVLQRLGVGGALLLPAVAAIVAPTAAQAYNGCVDCTVLSPNALTSTTQAARARQLQKSRSQGFGADSSDPFSSNYRPYTQPPLRQGTTNSNPDEPQQ